MQIHAYVNDEDLVRAFRRIAVIRFGKMKGSLSAAIEEAMREWVARHLADTHTNSGHKLPGGTTGRRLYAILNQFNRMWDGKNGQVEIPVGLLRKVIKMQAGVFDSRTINKYIKILTEMWIIEPSRPGYYLLDLDQLRGVISDEA